MMIDKQFLEKELEGLRLQLRNTEAQVNSIIGAIQVMEQLVAVLDKEEKPDDSNTGEH